MRWWEWWCQSVSFSFFYVLHWPVPLSRVGKYSTPLALVPLCRGANPTWRHCQGPGPQNAVGIAGPWHAACCLVEDLDTSGRSVPGLLRVLGHVLCLLLCPCPRERGAPWSWVAATEAGCSSVLLWDFSFPIQSAVWAARCEHPTPPQCYFCSLLTL